MKKITSFSTTLIFVLLLFCSTGIHAQTTKTQLKQVCLDNTEQFSITSKYVKDETYIIQVGLPGGYSTSNKSYPVLYVLDGEISFGTAKGISDVLILGQDIKDIIVIGISYGKGKEYWIDNRVRDFTPSKDTSWFPNAGGADNFLKFIQDELFHVVNKDYRTNPDSTAIFGGSLGGLLTSYILFKQPEMFKEYIILSPVLIWDSKSVLKLETEYFVNHKELNRTVYIAYSSLDDKEDITYPTDEFIKMIQMHNYNGLKLVKGILEGQTHASGFAIGITNGMKTLFHP